jgi:hypothetical protein
MNETAALPIQRPRRFYFDWIPAVFLRPRAAFTRIANEGRPTWLTPLLLLTLSALLVVAVAGPIRQAAAQSGEVRLPPDFQWWSPEQQAQFMQAQAATSGPVFIYVFPAILAVLGVWVGWMVMAGILHLVLTMLGGRGGTMAALNVTAWASLTFLLRDLMHAGAMLADRRLFVPGLLSFAPSAPGWLYAALAEVLTRIDFYAVWFVALLFVGVRAGNGLNRRAAFMGVLLAVAISLLLQVLPGVLGRQLSGLTIIRPFLF